METDRSNGNRSFQWKEIIPMDGDHSNGKDVPHNHTKRKVILMKAASIRKAFALFIATAAVFATASCASPQTPGSDGSSGNSQRENSEASGSNETGSNPESNPLTGNAQSQIQSRGNFAEAHDAFTTTLVREENDTDAIPAPPEGLFDLVSFPSKVGDLAAYVSSDPGDGQKHPIIIWVVGGWGNGIDDFPWCYPEWDNDQTGSAFWQAGLLTMYPSFRGGNGNPGHYEALFGEVDDIVSAYEYAASLPYVDPDRIYLGGHSTGGTRALLASEYTDKFRAVFCFGAVDEIKYHNNSQFTFDTENEEEHIMRSPIYWLENIKSPTFLIEGRDGNSSCLERMEAATQNENFHCYVIDDADHFSVLAPVTRMLAQKILADTGAEPNISITQEELDAAMVQEPAIPVPVMTRRTLTDPQMTFSCPYLWEITENSESTGLIARSRYNDDTPWDTAILFIDSYSLDEISDLNALKSSMETAGFHVADITVSGKPAIDASVAFQDDDGTPYYQRYVVIQEDSCYLNLNFFTYADYAGESNVLFQSIIDSIEF